MTVKIISKKIIKNTPANKNPPDRRVFGFILLCYSASQFLTSDVATLKNAYAELAEQARGYALGVSFEQLLFADVCADYHTLFIYKSCVEEIIKAGDRKLALHFRSEVIDYEQVAIIVS